jgi:hypothetical protein
VEVVDLVTGKLHKLNSLCSLPDVLVIVGMMEIVLRNAKLTILFFFHY